MSMILRVAKAVDHTKRIPIRDQKGWHVTPSKNAPKMLNGVNPISKGLKNFGEEKANKTYFFRELDAAVFFLCSQIEDYGDPVAVQNGKWTFASQNPLDYKVVILEFDLKGLTLYSDQEGREGAGFTTDYIPASKVELVPVKKWLPEARRFVKRFHKQKLA